MNFIKFFTVVLLITSITIVKATENDQSNNIRCSENLSSSYLKNGWYLWEPYQYNNITPKGPVLTGMDIEFVKAISKRVGIKVNYEQIAWMEHQEAIKDGLMDIASGATYTQDREKYAYFSTPYRFEENSLFVLNDNNKELKFSSISEFLAQIRLQNFKLGVTEGFIYADPQINLFISDPTNQDIVRKQANDVDSLEALIRGEIDGFLADRIVGAAAILKYKVNSNVEEVRLHIKTPIHLIFSKKTVPVSIVDKFNQEIKNFEDSVEYKNIVKTYLYPVLLLQTIDSEWFYFVGVIGTLAFAISGIAIAAKDNATLFGTFLFAMLPSVGGSIMRDILINREEVGLFLTPSYMYYIIIVVLIGFSSIRTLEYYNEKASEDQGMIKFWDNILVLGDAVGQAAFVVTGVSIVIMARIEPIELWGPFFAFLTANGGGIIRDLLRKKHHITCLTGTINAEVSILWGLIFSIYLDINSYNPDPDGIKRFVIIIGIGTFLTRVIAYYLKLPNLKFRAENNQL